MTKNFILLIFFAFTSHINCNEIQWRVRDLGTLSTFKDASVQDFNDRGQVLISGHKVGETYSTRPDVIAPNQYTVCSWAFWDDSYGLIPINDPWNGISPYSWHRINGDGLVIGLYKDKAIDINKKRVEYNALLITWQQGVRHNYGLPLANKDPNSSSSAFVAHCRNSKSVIVTCSYDQDKAGGYDARVLALQDNQIRDLTPSLRKSAASLGYDAGNLLAIAVNSQGMILGRFDCYEKNPYKNTSGPTGRKYFLWSNNEMYLIEGTEELVEWFGNRSFIDADHISLDANGKVLFYVFVKARRSWESWVWTKENGLNLIGGGHIRGLGLLDDSSIFWSVTGSENADGFVFQKKDQIFDGFAFPNEHQNLHLSLDRSRQPFSKDLGEFKGVKIKTSILYGTWPLFNGVEFNANSRRQLFFTGEFFGESHPFLIEPVFE